MEYFYRTYGLIIESEIELPELQSVEAQSSDVRIRMGPVPEKLPGSRSFREWAEYTSTQCILEISKVGRYLIDGGETITVQPCRANERPCETATPLADVRLFLIGSAFAALLHQRKLVPLHISAVLGPHGVWSFTGPSGAGKSTIAGWLSKKMGYPLLSDDVAVAEWRGGHIRLHPGPRRLKLWSDAVKMLDIRGKKLVQDLSNTQKYQLYLSDEAPPGDFALTNLVLLEKAEPQEQTQLHRVKGVDRFRFCCNAVYRHHMTAWFRTREEYIGSVFQIAENIEVYRLRRPWSHDLLEQQYELLRTHLSPNDRFSSEDGLEVATK